MDETRTDSTYHRQDSSSSNSTESTTELTISPPKSRDDGESVKMRLLDATSIDSNNSEIETKPTTNAILEKIAALSEEIKAITSPCPRRVSFPKSDRELVTGYLEPVNPWESVVKTADEIVKYYTDSCTKHSTEPITPIVDHLRTLRLSTLLRHPCLNLREQKLTPAACEALEEILKRVQYNLIDLTACGLNDLAASALFDMIEFYEAANELDISENPDISTRGWQSCVSMLRRSRELHTLIVRGTALSETNSANLGKSLNESALHTIKLEHCGLTGRPLTSLCNALKKNVTLKELWLAYNDLIEKDAEKISDMLKSNYYLQFLDISNNNIKDDGVKHIAIALIQQSTNILYSSRHSFSGYDSNKSNSLNRSDGPNGQETDEDNKKLYKSMNAGRSMLGTLLNLNMTPPLSPPPPNVKANLSERAKGNNNDNQRTQDVVISCDIVKTSTPIKATDEIPDLYIKDTVDSPTVPPSDKEDASMKSVEDDELFLQNNNIKNSTRLDYDEDVFDESSTQPKDFDVNKNTNIVNVLEAGGDQQKAAEKTDEENDKKPRIVIPPVAANLIVVENSPNNSSVVVLNVPSTDLKDHMRSPSTESLSSENSIEIHDSKLSAKHNEKLTKNDTLGRQKNSNEILETSRKYKGLQAIVLWNNNLSRHCGEYISDLLAVTNSLEFLNIGKNILSNDFVATIERSLAGNCTLTSLGLQSAHLTCVGIKTLSKTLEFGGNSTIKRIDIRDNNIQAPGLLDLAEAIKTNKSIVRIDIDDVPKRLPDDEHDSPFNYSKILHEIRTLCTRNQAPEGPIRPNTVAGSATGTTINSRKISLTCQSLRPPLLEQKHNRVDINLLDVKQRKTGSRLRSPAPSPPTASPSSSPVPSPSRSRFQVFRVTETNTSISPCSSPISSITGSTTKPIKIGSKSSPGSFNCDRVVRSPGSRFRVTPVDSSNESLNLPSTPKPKEKSHGLTETASTDNLLKTTTIESDILSQRCLSVDNIINDDRSSSLINRVVDESFSSSSSIDSFGLMQDSLHSQDIGSYNDAIADNIQLHDKHDDILLELSHKTMEATPPLPPERSLPLKENTNVQNEDQNSRNKNTSHSDTAPESRVRKLSWIASANYPSAVDRLISLFHNPTNLFLKSADIDSSPPKTTSGQLNTQSSGGIFGWSRLPTQPTTQQDSSKTPNSNNNPRKRSLEVNTSVPVTIAPVVTTSIFDAASKQIKGIADFGKQVFKQNITLGVDSFKVAEHPTLQRSGAVQGTGGGAITAATVVSEMSVESKENISPENTITLLDPSSIINVQNLQGRLDYDEHIEPLSDNKLKSTSLEFQKLTATVSTASESLTQEIDPDCGVVGGGIGAVLPGYIVGGGGGGGGIVVGVGAGGGGGGGGGNGLGGSLNKGGGGIFEIGDNHQNHLTPETLKITENELVNQT